MSSPSSLRRKPEPRNLNPNPKCHYLQESDRIPACAGMTVSPLTAKFIVLRQDRKEGARGRWNDPPSRPSPFVRGKGLVASARRGLKLSCNELVNWENLLSKRSLVAAATAPAATSAAAHGRQRAEVAAAGISPGYRGKYGDGPAGGLLTAGAIRPGGAHGLELLKLVVAGGAMVLVQRHSDLPKSC